MAAQDAVQHDDGHERMDQSLLTTNVNCPTFVGHPLRLTINGRCAAQCGYRLAEQLADTFTENSTLCNRIIDKQPGNSYVPPLIPR